jgi:hypothetical protein
LRIQYAIPCRYAEGVGDINNILGGGIDTTMVQGLPVPVGLMVALRVVGAVDEMVGETLDFHCHVAAPDGTDAGFALDHELGPIEAPAARQDWPVGLVLSFGIQWQAETEGTYMIHLQVNDQYDALPMHVVVAS